MYCANWDKEYNNYRFFDKNNCLFFLDCSALLTRTGAICRRRYWTLRKTLYEFLCDYYEGVNRKIFFRFSPLIFPLDDGTILQEMNFGRKFFLLLKYYVMSCFTLDDFKSLNTISKSLVNCLVNFKNIYHSSLFLCQTI